MTNYRSDFKPCRPGNIACPKCFGETEIDMTPRDASGWPWAGYRRVTCDHCEGAGEIAKQSPNVGNPHMVANPVIIEHESRLTKALKTIMTPGFGEDKPEPKRDSWGRKIDG